MVTEDVPQREVPSAPTTVSSTSSSTSFYSPETNSKGTSTTAPRGEVAAAARSSFPFSLRFSDMYPVDDMGT